MKMYKVIFFMFLAVFFCACVKETERSLEDKKTDSVFTSKIPEEISLNRLKHTELVPTLENKLSDSLNSIYTPTLLFAWQEIKDYYKDSIQISSSNSFDFRLINESNTFQNTLGKGEYETKIEASADFVVAEAYFKKMLPFAAKFHSHNEPVLFYSDKVRAFGLNYPDYERLQYFDILYYLDDDHFAIKLLPADTCSEIILAKGIELIGSFSDLYKNTNEYIEKGIKEIEIKEKHWRYIFEEGDYLSIPAIKFNIGTNYSSLEGQKFSAGTKDHEIMKAYQSTAFVFDEYGAVVESYSMIACDTASSEKPVPKKLIFDKPFVIFIKKKTSINPYFAMKVMNAELMEKK